MREVDFRHLKATLESLNASTDLVLVSGQVKATFAHQASPYASRRQVRFDVVPPLVGENVLLAANYRKIMLAGRDADAVKQATETIGRDGRPFEGSLLGWDGPWADWVCEPVPPTLHLLQGLLQFARDYGVIGSEWLESPLVYAAWLVPVVVEWDEDGRPVFSWPERPDEPESEPADQGLPVEV